MPVSFDEKMLALPRRLGEGGVLTMLVCKKMTKPVKILKFFFRQNVTSRIFMHFCHQVCQDWGMGGAEWANLGGEARQWDFSS